MRDEDRNAVLTGLFVVICGLLILGTVVVLARRSQLFGDNYNLFAPFDNVQGLETGSMVRVAGVNAGMVTRIEISPEPGERKVIARLRIDASFKPKIRGDSMATIKSLGPLGDKYIEVSMGSSGFPELKDGENIATLEPIDLYDVAEETRRAIKALGSTTTALNSTLEEFRRSRTLANLETSTASIAGIVKSIEEGPGPMHTLLFDKEFEQSLRDLQNTISTLRDYFHEAVNDERGMARAMLGPDFNKAVVHMQESSAGVRRIIDKVETGEGLLHRLVYSEDDAQLVAQLRLTAAELEDMIRVIRDGDNLLNAMLYDPEQAKIISEIGESAARLRSIMDKVDAHEGTLGLLISDPVVWEDLRRLLGGVQRSRTLKFVIGRSLKAGQPEPAEKAD